MGPAKRYPFSSNNVQSHCHVCCVAVRSILSLSWTMRTQAAESWHWHALSTGGRMAFACQWHKKLNKSTSTFMAPLLVQLQRQQAMMNDDDRATSFQIWARSVVKSFVRRLAVRGRRTSTSVRSRSKSNHAYGSCYTVITHRGFVIVRSLVPLHIVIRQPKRCCQGSRGLCNEYYRASVFKTVGSSACWCGCSAITRLATTHHQGGDLEPGSTNEFHLHFHGLSNLGQLSFEVKDKGYGRLLIPALGRVAAIS